MFYNKNTTACLRAFDPWARRVLDVADVHLVGAPIYNIRYSCLVTKRNGFENIRRIASSPGDNNFITILQYLSSIVYARIPAAGTTTVLLYVHSVPAKCNYYHYQDTENRVNRVRYATLLVLETSLRHCVILCWLNFKHYCAVQ